jgi:hypothetical protein
MKFECQVGCFGNKKCVLEIPNAENVAYKVSFNDEVKLKEVKIGDEITLYCPFSGDLCKWVRKE